MAWTLEIHTIDVGQGESSLIIAKNIVHGDLTDSRTMLIDGGLQSKAEHVFNFVWNKLQATELTAIDIVLTTHYDQDHSGGISKLLTVDSFYKLYDDLAEKIDDELNALDTEHRNRAAVTCVTSAIAFSMIGGAPFRGDDDVDMSGGDDVTVDEVNGCVVQALTEYYDGSTSNPAFWSYEDARDRGIRAARDVISAHSVPLRNRLHTNTKRSTLLNLIVGGAWDIFENRGTVDIRKAMLDRILDNFTFTGWFNTRGIFKNATLVDIGDGSYTDSSSESYTLMTDGKAVINGDTIWPYGGTRLRLYPDLKSELFFGEDDIPTNAPTVFVVARNASYWDSSYTGEIYTTMSTDKNKKSIALLVKFNRFMFFTGGDLTSEEENAIATSFANSDSNKPWTDDTPNQVTSSKAGHHGSRNSTSTTLLDEFSPRSVFVSASGRTRFGRSDDTHPNRDTMKRLVQHTSIRRVYLTNLSPDYPKVGYPLGYRRRFMFFLDKDMTNIIMPYGLYFDATYSSEAFEIRDINDSVSSTKIRNSTNSVDWDALLVTANSEGLWNDGDWQSKLGSTLLATTIGQIERISGIVLGTPAPITLPNTVVVAGDSNANNNAEHRVRGNFSLTITQAESVKDSTVARNYNVGYRKPNNITTPTAYTGTTDSIRF